MIDRTNQEIAQKNRSKVEPTEYQNDKLSVIGVSCFQVRRCFWHSVTCHSLLIYCWRVPFPLSGSLLLAESCIQVFHLAHRHLHFTSL